MQSERLNGLHQVSLHIQHFHAVMSLRTFKAIYLIFFSRLITSRLETNVLRVLTPYFTTAKDPRVKQSLIKSTSLFGKSLHSSHLHAEYVFPKRNSLLKFVQVCFFLLCLYFNLVEK